MRRLRFALALVALALAGSADIATASAGCPMAYVAEQPYGTCGFTGVGSSCESCEYECADGEKYTWNMCQVGS